MRDLEPKLIYVEPCTNLSLLLTSPKKSTLPELKENPFLAFQICYLILIGMIIYWSLI